jgi:hypothetical protein
MMAAPAADPLDEPLARDETTGEYVARYDWKSAIPLSTVLVELVAEVTEADPLALEPLGRAVDPEAMDGLFTSTRAYPGNYAAGSRLAFRFEGLHVTIESDGVIRLEP